ncbi:MAG TPA: hypothetical protein VJZ76_07720 [Thermoanaerobaculia bacterium]|nr:hypothetical protein [Thermoanaerobaculia bacterium]
MKRLTDALAAGALFIASLVVYRKILRLWWMYDDPFLVNLLRQFSLPQSLYARDLYHALGRPIFNPLLMFSLKADLLAFGLDTTRLYVHHLIAFALIPPLLYLLCRLWTPPLASLATAGTALVAGPTLEVVPQLMLRHYIEGGVFALAAAILFVLAVRRANGWLLTAASALLYLSAAAAKEVYAPLILVLLVVPEGTWRQRIRLLIPHAVAAAIFGIWRIAVVGTSVKPFGFVEPPSRRPISIATVPFRAIRQFANSGSAAGWAMLVAVLLCALIVVVRMPRARIVAAAAIVAVVAPLIPVSGEMNPRWAFAPWLLAVVAIAFLARALPRGGAVAALVVLGIALVDYRVEWPPAYRRFLRISDEGRVFSLLGENDVIHNPIGTPTTLMEIGKLTGSKARALYDDFPLCDDPNFRVGRIFEFDPVRREVAETTRAAAARSCASIRRMPLALDLHFERDGSFFWTAGPYRDGQYTFILIDGLLAYDVPREAGFRADGFEHFNLRVRYTSPQGWKTYSPMLTVDSKNGPLRFRQ